MRGATLPSLGHGVFSQSNLPICVLPQLIVLFTPAALQQRRQRRRGDRVWRANIATIFGHGITDICTPRPSVFFG